MNDLINTPEVNFFFILETNRAEFKAKNTIAKSYLKDEKQSEIVIKPE